MTEGRRLAIADPFEILIFSSPPCPVAERRQGVVILCDEFYETLISCGRCAGGRNKIPEDQAVIIPFVLEFVVGIDHFRNRPKHSGIEFYVALSDADQRRSHTDIHSGTHDGRHLFHVKPKQFPSDPPF